MAGFRLREWLATLALFKSGGGGGGGGGASRKFEALNTKVVP